MKQHYGKDLAYIHDAGFGGFARRAAAGLLEILERHDIEMGLVVDLGCGSGIWAGELCRAGYDVLGIDISAAMIELARRRAPGAKFRCGSLLDAELPRCDAVTSIGECVNYLFDQKAGEEALVRLFRRVHDALRTGGIFVCDILTNERAKRDDGRAPHAEGEDWAVLVRIEYDRANNELLRHITAFRKVGKYYRRSEELHRVRLYDRKWVAAQLREAGFRVRMLRGFGDFKLTSGHVVYVARKP